MVYVQSNLWGGNAAVLAVHAVLVSLTRALRAYDHNYTQYLHHCFNKHLFPRDFEFAVPDTYLYG